MGLEEVDDGVYDLYFCFHQIGRYLLQDNKIEDFVSRVPVTRRQIDLARRAAGKRGVSNARRAAERAEWEKRGFGSCVGEGPF